MRKHPKKKGDKKNKETTTVFTSLLKLSHVLSARERLLRKKGGFLNLWEHHVVWGKRAITQIHYVFSRYDHVNIVIFHLVPHLRGMEQPWNNDVVFILVFSTAPHQFQEWIPHLYFSFGPTFWHRMFTMWCYWLGKFILWKLHPMFPVNAHTKGWSQGYGFLLKERSLNMSFYWKSGFWIWVSIERVVFEYEFLLKEQFFNTSFYWDWFHILWNAFTLTCLIVRSIWLNWQHAIGQELPRYVTYFAAFWHVLYPL